MTRLLDYVVYMTVLTWITIVLGVLALTAHFEPWELLPPSWARQDVPIHVVARPLDNPRLDDLLNAWRERGGNQVIRKREIRAILRVLRRGETVGILIDHHINEREGVVVPFFGRPASTTAARPRSSPFGRGRRFSRRESLVGLGGDVIASG